MKPLLCIGEIAWERRWLLDRFPSPGRDSHCLKKSATAGGSAVNTAIALRGLGHDVELIGNSLGCDGAGERLYAYLNKFKLDANLLRNGTIRTPVCNTLVSRTSAERVFTLEYQSIQETPPTCIQSVERAGADVLKGRYEFIFVQPYLKHLTETFLRVIGKDHRCWVLAQDVSFDSPALDYCDSVQLSWENLALDRRSFKSVNAVSASQPPVTESQLQRLCAPFFRERLNLVLVTFGSLGAAAVDRDGQVLWVRNPWKVAARDTTGCGDAFRAGFLSGRVQQQSVEDCLGLGLKLGAYKATRPGPHAHAAWSEIETQLHSSAR